MRRKLLYGKRIGILAVLLVLFMAVGHAEEERIDAGGRWRYVLEDGGATIMKHLVYPRGVVVIPGELDGFTVTGIGENAFLLDENLTHVTIPESVTSIGSGAFSGCSSLTSITIPDGVTSIGDFAFFECARLTETTIPASVIRIGLNPFARCAHKNIRVASANPVYADTKGVLFDKIQKALIAYPVGRSGKYVIPKGTLRIGESAFEWSAGLTGVTIPGSVTEIGEGAFNSFGAITLHVVKGSFAEQYAEENRIPYVFATK